jgi:hypothetical protein
MIREDIVKKLNSQSKFRLNNDEIQFILSNWLTIHSQYHSEAILRFDANKGILADVEIDKESFYKHF